MPVSSAQNESAPAQTRLDEVLRALALGVQALRIEREMTVTGLAFEAGLSESTIRAVESARGGPTISTLVALADSLGVGVADLFGDTVVVNGGVPENERPAHSPRVVPSEVVWGGDLPPAPWLDAAVAPSSPAVDPRADVAVAAPSPAPDAVPPRPRPTEVVWGGALPPAPWHPSPFGEVPPARAHEVPPATPSREDPPPAHTAAPGVHNRAVARGMHESSAYVFVSPDAEQAHRPAPSPRTFADLRKGPLAGRTFPSLRQFAVASVLEAGHPVADIARVFRVPVWRLETWVAEAGGTAR